MIEWMSWIAAKSRCLRQTKGRRWSRKACPTAISPAQGRARAVEGLCAAVRRIRQAAAHRRRHHRARPFRGRHGNRDPATPRLRHARLFALRQEPRAVDEFGADRRPRGPARSADGAHRLPPTGSRALHAFDLHRSEAESVQDAVAAVARHRLCRRHQSNGIALHDFGKRSRADHQVGQIARARASTARLAASALQIDTSKNGPEDLERIKKDLFVHVGEV